MHTQLWKGLGTKLDNMTNENYNRASEFESPHFGKIPQSAQKSAVSQRKDKSIKPSKKRSRA